MSALGSLVQGIELPLFILFALLAVGLGVYLAIQFLRHRKEQKADEAVAKAEAHEKEAPHGEVAEAGEPILSPRLMRSSFRHGYAAYREYVAGSRNPYLVPWFLAAGLTDSGLSSLCTSIETHRAPAETPDPVTGKSVGTVWRYHDQAVLIEVGGEAFGRGNVEGAAAGDKNADAAWTALLDELVARRGQQPIDGIVLAIPVTEFYGPTAPMPHVLADKAARIYAKLWQAQKITGLCLPVYIVITKCDLLPGFQELVDALPASRLGDILGWSSPYPLESSFKPEWIDEAIDSVENGLVNTGLELAAEGMRPPLSSGLFQLPAELSTLRAPIATSLGVIFRRTAYQEALYFRGIYFTGAAEPMAESLDGTARRAQVPGKLPLAFARDLFESKVFRERDLTKSTPRWSAAHNRKQQIWTGAAIAASVLALLLLWQGAVRLADLQAAYLQPLQQLPVALRASREVERDPSNVVAQNQANAAQMIRIAGRIDSPWSDPWFPAAWLDSLDDRVRTALAIGHWRLMMGDIRLHLGQRGQALEAGDVSVPPTAGGQTPELARLRTFVGDALLLERFANVYNRLVNTEDTTGLTELLRYTHGIELPPGYLDLARQIAFYKQPTNRELRGASIDFGTNTFDLAPLRAPLATELDQLADAYFQRLAANGDALARLRSVTSEVDALAGTGNASLPPTALETLQRDLNQTATVLTSQDGTWLAGGDDKNFGGAAFQTLLKVVGDSPLFGPSARDRLLVLGRATLGRSIADVKLADSAIGPLASGVAERNRVELTPTAEGLRTSLRNLLARPFMAAGTTTVDLNTLGRSGPIQWDLGGLERAVALAENFALFVASDLPSFPAPIQAGVRNVAQQRLTGAVVAQVLRAVTPGQSSSGRIEAELRSQVQSNVSAYPLLSKLVQNLRQNGAQVAADRLLNIAALQATVLLGQIDNLLEGEQLYLPAITAPGAFSKDKIDAAALYGQPDMPSLQGLLDRDRQRVTTVANELAQPLLTFLARPDIGSAASEGVVGRWIRTQQELEKAAQGRPAGSLAALERFLTVELPDLTPWSCAKLSSPQPLTGSNYFSDQLRVVRVAVHQQCVTAEENRIATSYRTVERSFTDLLQGRYPFALYDAAASGDFATTDDVANFYKAFDPLSEALLNGLHDREAEGALMRAPTEFVEAMKKGRAFLKPLVGLDDTVEAGASIEPHFRALTNHERGGEEIIQWQLGVNDDLIDATMQGKSLTWHPRDPITVSFRWASNAPRVPVGVLGRGKIQVSGRTVSITYDNAWALVALLQQHRPRPNEWRAGPGRPPEMVAFDIPTGRADGKPGSESAARVFIELAIHALPGADGKASGERLGMPDFPIKVPPLPRIGTVSLGTPSSSLFGTQ